MELSSVGLKKDLSNVDIAGVEAIRAAGRINYAAAYTLTSGTVMEHDAVVFICANGTRGVEGWVRIDEQIVRYHWTCSGSYGYCTNSGACFIAPKGSTVVQSGGSFGGMTAFPIL